MRPPTPEAVDVAADPDPVGAVLVAHEQGRPILLRTGGTTGSPRAVLRSTASWFDSFADYGTLAGIGGDSVVAIAGPLSATMNLFAAVHASWTGAATTADLAEATHVVLTPARLHQALDTAALAPGIVAVVAGDRMTAALADRAARHGVATHHYYGAAELSFVAWGAHAEALSSFPGVQVAAPDGRVRVRSPYLAEAAFDGHDWRPVRDRDGWAGVGDVGGVVGDRVVVQGRPGAVTSAGATVVLADVEASLADLEVVVIGVPHQRLGAVLVGVLPPHVPTSEARRIARRLLPPSHRPRRWVHLVDPPLTAHGKIDREALARLVQQRLGIEEQP